MITLFLGNPNHPNPPPATTSPETAHAFRAASKRLLKLEEKIQKIPVFQNTQTVDVHLFFGPFHECLSLFRVLGFAPTNNFMTVSFNTSFNVQQNPHDPYLPPTFAHERHHNLRNTPPISTYGETLGERLISEGLAQNFEYTFSGHAHDYSFTLLSIPRNITDQTTAFLKQHVASKNNFDFLFFDQTRTAYSYANLLVGAWLAKNKTTAVECAHINASEILNPWLNDNLSPFDPQPLPHKNKILRTLSLPSASP